MKIGGFQKLTLLDYPGQVACILFTAGCNFRCPFCHNAGLVTADTGAEASETEILAYLKKRQGILDGIVVSGGEPLLQPGLRPFLTAVKRLGYLVKLDTNGSFPNRMERLMREGLVDYVAMDLKHIPERYSQAAGIDDPGLLPRIERGIALLRTGIVPFEFRTTLVKGIHRPEDAGAIAAWVAGSQPYYLQSYTDSGAVLCPDHLEAFSEPELRRMLCAAKQHCPNAALRGV